MLKQRILTALIVGPIFAWVTIWANNTVFNAFWALVVALAAHEWARLLGWVAVKNAVFVILTTAISALGMYASLNWMTWHHAGTMMVLTVLVAALVWLFLVPWWLRGYAQKGRIPLPNVLLAIIGCLLLASFSLAMMMCRAHVGGVGLFGLFVLVWCADIGAYFAGRRFGKRPLAPAISPKKTKEGFVGGWLLAMLAALVYYYTLQPAFPASLFFATTAVVIAYATVGDLFESVLKRRCGLKDSGRILPGHGGVLDRIDSWLPALVLWASMFFWSMI